jgi:hypothetical protein
MLRAASKPVDRAARAVVPTSLARHARRVPSDVDGPNDAITMTSRLGACRLYFFLIPVKTCRISAILLRGFQMWTCSSIAQKLHRRAEENRPGAP